MSERILTVPLKEEEVRQLKVGDIAYLKGLVYTLRDMGHLAVKNIYENEGAFPINFEGAAIFHAGPVVLEKNGVQELVVIGPTTSIRMEPYAEMMGKLGVRAIIGKGGMGEESSEAYKKYGGVYLQAAPGCAVKLAEGVECIDGVHWRELGMPEALWMLRAAKLGPLVVAMDSYGDSIYRDLRKQAMAKIEAAYG